MQTGLTKNVYDKYKIRNSNRIYKNKIILPFIIILIIVILIYMIYPKHYEYWNQDYNVYFLLADNNISQTNLSKVVSRVEDYGGAGVVSDLNEDKNSVIIYAYFDFNDAKKIYENNKYLFSNSFVKSIKIEKINKNLQTKIQNDSGLLSVYEFYYNEKYITHNLILEHEKGNVSFKEIYNYSYKLKDKLLILQKHLGDSDISKKLYDSIGRLVDILNAFMKNNLTGDYSILFIKKFVINLILEEMYIKSDIL